MRDERKTNEALTKELTAARQRIAGSAAPEATQKHEADRLRRKAALDSVRLSVYKMKRTRDIQNVLTGLCEALGLSGVVFNECSVQVVDEKREHFTVATAGPHEINYLGPERSMLAPLGATAVHQAWRHRRTVYRKDLRKEDRYNEGSSVSSAYGASIRSVVDVPFSQGTVAINSTEPNAFSKADIETVANLADVLSEAYGRVEQIRRVEESEQLHRAIVERSKDIIFQLDPGGNCVLVSPAVRSLTGHPRSAFYANAALWHHIILPEDIRRVEEGREKALSGKTSREVELRLCRKDGGVRWAVETVYPVKDTQGRVIAIEGRIHDITRRKRAEEALRESEARYRAVVESQSDLVARALPDGTLTFCNEACARYFSKKRKDLTGHSFMPLVYCEDQEKVRERLASFTPEDPFKMTDYRVVRPDGGIRWLHWAHRAMFDEGGQLTGFQCVGRDITDRKHAEEALRESEQRFRELAELSPFAVSIIGSDGRYVYLNPKFTEVFGYTLTDVPDGRAWFRQAFPNVKRREEAISAWLSDLERSAPHQVRPREFDVTAKDGSVRRVLFRPITLSDGKQFVTYEDLTERRHAEQKLLEHQQQLRSLASELLLAEERERRQFATELHSRVGQALAIAKIKLGGLQEIVTSEAVDSGLGAVRGRIEECIRATRSLTLELSPPVLYEQGLVAALDWLTERTQEQIDIPIVFRDDGKPKPLDEDIAVFLFQAARELLVNVGKHAHAQEVQVQVRAFGDSVKIIIKDDGVGFDVSEAAPRPDRNGGYGLFSIRERLDYVSGRLEIASKRGGGTQATLIAPLKHENQPQKGK